MHPRREATELTRTLPEAGEPELRGMKRRLLLLGATGLTGQQLLVQALEQGHDITALVRNLDKLSTAHSRLRAVVGSSTDPAVVDEALEGRDAVLCALGTR